MRRIILHLTPHQRMGEGAESAELIGRKGCIHEKLIFPFVSQNNRHAFSLLSQTLLLVQYTRTATGKAVSPTSMLLLDSLVGENAGDIGKQICLPPPPPPTISVDNFK
jgi:hypothetical protein